MLDKKISELTVREFLEISKNINDEVKLLIGIKGLARFLQCSYRHAQYLNSTGLLDKATFKVGGLIYFDKKEVLTILKSNPTLTHRSYN